MKIKSILAATGISQIDKALSAVKGYEVVDIVNSKKDLLELCDFYKPEILVISDALKGSQLTQELLFTIRSKSPSIRIIYLVGEVDIRNKEKVNSIGYLVLNGIYDIVADRKFNLEVLATMLDNEKTLQDSERFTKYISQSDVITDVIEFEEEEEEEDEGDVYGKIYTFSSIKPGSGKTTISVSVATAIAKYGKSKPNGQRPKVALIEADLQNLSVGTFLQIESEKKNLKVALDKIATLFNDNGDLIARASQMDEVNKVVKSCFQPYYHVKNLEALTGSQLKYSEIKNIKPHQYIYLLESILDEYDVVIVDSNSNVEHATTEPMLLMAKSCYYVLNLDYNNVRNNARYRSTLREMGVSDKVKYILNEDVEEDSMVAGVDIEPLEFTKEHLREVGFDTVADVPMLPKTVYLNRLHDGKPVVLDDKEYTRKAKYQLLKIANDIWHIDGFEELEKQILGTDDLNSKKKKKGLLW